MISKERMSLTIPRDVRAWIVEEAGKRRLSISEYMLVLLTRGMQADAIDKSIVRIEAVTKTDTGTTEVLRQVLELRYLVDQIAKQAGNYRVTSGTDAAAFANRELAKLAKAAIS